MPSPIGMNVFLTGKKEDINQVFDQIMKNQKEIDDRKFSRIEERIPLNQWNPELDFTYSQYVRPFKEGDTGYFSCERFYEGMWESVLDLSEQHPTVTFVYSESTDYGHTEVTFKNGKVSNLKEEYN
jgi:protease II